MIYRGVFVWVAKGAWWQNEEVRTNEDERKVFGDAPSRATVPVVVHALLPR